MTQFDESKHNRHSDGKFTHKPHAEAEGVTLTTSRPHPDTPATVEALYDYLEDVNTKRMNLYTFAEDDGTVRVSIEGPHLSTVTTVTQGATVEEAKTAVIQKMGEYSADTDFTQSRNKPRAQADNQNLASHLRNLQEEETWRKIKAGALSGKAIPLPATKEVETTQDYPIRSDQFPATDAEVTEDNINKFLTAANLWHGNTEVLPYPDGQGYDINIYAPNNLASRITVHAHADDNMGDVYDKTSETMRYEFDADDAFAEEWADPDFQATSNLTPSQLLTMFDADQKFFEERSRELADLG